LSIHYLVTHPRYRRRGIGRELIEAAAKKARDLGARIAYLEVRLKNEAAQALYRACGFTVGAERKKYYADDGDSALLMAMRLE
jgi:ribosomal protein S18 acetylase RimI-like enzyme